MPNNSFALHRKQSSANIYQSSRHFHLLGCQEVYLLNSKVDGYPLVWLIRTLFKVHFQLSLVWQKHLLNDFRCEQFWWGCEVLQTLAQQEAPPPMDKHCFEQRNLGQLLYCRHLKITLFSWSAKCLDLDQIFHMYLFWINPHCSLRSKNTLNQTTMFLLFWKSEHLNEILTVNKFKELNVVGKKWPNPVNGNCPALWQAPLLSPVHLIDWT